MNMKENITQFDLFNETIEEERHALELEKKYLYPTLHKLGYISKKEYNNYMNMEI